MTSHPGYASDGTTLVAVLDGYEADGYTGQLAALEGGRVRCFSCGGDSAAEELAIDSLRRTEGASDPADMVAVAAVSCPRCAQRGTLVLKYGPEAAIEDSEVLTAIEPRARLDEDRASGGIGHGGGGFGKAGS